MNFFKKLQDSLKKTSEKFTKGIDEIFNKSKPQVEILQDIEDILIQAWLWNNSKPAMKLRISLNYGEFLTCIKSQQQIFPDFSRYFINSPGLPMSRKLYWRNSFDRATFRSELFS